MNARNWSRPRSACAIGIGRAVRRDSIEFAATESVPVPMNAALPFAGCDPATEEV